MIDTEANNRRTLPASRHPLGQDASQLGAVDTEIVRPLQPNFIVDVALENLGQRDACGKRKPCEQVSRHARKQESRPDALPFSAFPAPITATSPGPL